MIDALRAQPGETGTIGFVSIANNLTRGSIVWLTSTAAPANEANASIARWAPAGDAATAASDWGGDRLALFAEGNQRVVLWHLAFDDDAAAKRALVLFARGALRPELGASGAGEAADARVRPFAARRAAETAVRSGRLCRPRAERGAFAIVRHGRHIGVTLGPYLRGVTTVRASDNCPQALAIAELVAKQQ